MSSHELVEAMAGFSARIDLRPTASGFHTVGFLPDSADEDRIVAEARDTGVVVAECASVFHNVARAFASAAVASQRSFEETGRARQIATLASHQSETSERGGDADLVSCSSVRLEARPEPLLGRRIVAGVECQHRGAAQRRCARSPRRARPGANGRVGAAVEPWRQPGHYSARSASTTGGAPWPSSSGP